MNYTKNIIKMKNVSNEEIEILVCHLIIKDLSEVKDIIEKEIVDIWDTLVYSLDEVKKSIYNFISSKTDQQKHAACAEFFMHLLLRQLGFKQKCAFCNLEENSFKKGFDGFYEKYDDFWIAESKCAVVKNFHKNKVKEALNDIDVKICNCGGNNPWRNAYNHLLIRQTSRTESIAKQVANLSNDYLNKVSHKSSEFNIIPVSTLFVNNCQTDEEILKDLQSLINSRQIKAMNILCINNDIYDEFIAYLKGE